MKKRIGNLVFLAIVCVGLPARAIAPLPDWNRSFGDVNNQTGSSVVVSSTGDVYVAGTFTGTINLGGTDLVSTGSGSIFLARFNPAGVHQWSKSFGSVVGVKIALDGSSNIYATGPFALTTNFGGGNLTSAGLGDIYLVKFSSDGVHQWSQRFGDSNQQAAFAIAASSSGDVAVTGTFLSTVNFGGSNLVANGTYEDIFLVKFNSAGVHQWSKRFGGTLPDYGKAVVFDVADVTLLGDFQGTINFGSGNLSSAGGYDVFMARFTSGGAWYGNWRWGGSSDDRAADMAVHVAGDGTHNYYLTGQFQGSAYFGQGYPLVSAGGMDIFLAKVVFSGIYISYPWSRGFGDENSQGSKEVALDTSGNVYLTGYFNGTTDFGTGNLVSAGADDIFLAKFNSSGVTQWSERFGDSSQFQSGEALAVDASGKVIVTGLFQGTVNFGAATLTSAGSRDAFLVKLGQLFSYPTISSIVDVGNDQGRRVKIDFQRSQHDAPGSATPVLSYEAYRRDDFSSSALSSADMPTGLSEQTLLEAGWTQVGKVTAHGEPLYSMVVPTIVDSTKSSGQYYSKFFLRAATVQPLVYYQSPVDSGYSLDNLAPVVSPGSLGYSAGVLTWAPSTAEDFGYFSVYGSNSDEFGLVGEQAMTATLIARTVEHMLDVSAYSYVFYFVTATDLSGNEGPPAVINTLSGINGTPTPHLLSISAYPNPFNPETTLQYSVPWKGATTIAIYDARGTRVATLADGVREEGWYTQTWAGRSDTGSAVSSGVYFARIQHPSGTRISKIVLVK